MSKKSAAKPGRNGQAQITVIAHRTAISRLKAFLQSECRSLGVSISVKPLDGEMRVTCPAAELDTVRELLERAPNLKFRVA